MHKQKRQNWGRSAYTQGPAFPGRSERFLSTLHVAVWKIRSVTSMGLALIRSIQSGPGARHEETETRKGTHTHTDAVTVTDADLGPHANTMPPEQTHVNMQQNGAKSGNARTETT